MVTGGARIRSGAAAGGFRISVTVLGGGDGDLRFGLVFRLGRKKIEGKLGEDLYLLSTYCPIVLCVLCSVR